MSERKEKRLGWRIAIIAIVLHLAGFAIYLMMSHQRPDPRMVGHWYGFHEEEGYTYDYLAHRDAEGKFQCQFRFFENPATPGAATPVPPPAVELAESFRGTTTGKWHSDGSGYSTEEGESQDPFGPLGLGDKIRWWLQHREWPDDEIAYDYQVVRLTAEAVSYRNPETDRLFWNIRVPAGSSFPDKPLGELAAREHFPLPPPAESQP